MNGHAIAARGAAALVALVAGAASYEHIASVALAAGERAWVAHSLPAAIDGLIIVGVSALLEDRRAGLKPRLIARVAVAVGVIATLAANVASAHPTWTGRLVAVAAPVAFLLSVEVLTRSGKRAAAMAVEPVQEAEPDPAPEPAVTRPAPVRARPRALTAAERVTAAHQKEPAAPRKRIAELAGVSESTVKRHRPAGSPSRPDAAETVLEVGSPEPIGAAA